MYRTRDAAVPLTRMDTVWSNVLYRSGVKTQLSLRPTHRYAQYVASMPSVSSMPSSKYY